MICEICNREFKTDQALRSHKWRSHTESGLKHHEKVTPSLKGRKAWNKGLTKDTDERVKNNSEKVAAKQKILGHPWIGRSHSIESRKKLSLALSKNNRGGRCKWYVVKNGIGNFFNVQGTWERDFTEYLNTIDDEWIKIGVGHINHSYPWKDENGMQHYYTPDFWSPKLKKYFEVKGHWWGKDKEKMKKILEQHNLNLEIVNKERLELYLNRKIS